MRSIYSIVASRKFKRTYKLAAFKRDVKDTSQGKTLESHVENETTLHL